MCCILQCEHIVHFIELTIPFEGAIEAAFERKKLKYAELVAEASQQGCQAHTRPLEIGVSGFVAKSTTTLLLDFGFEDSHSRTVTRRLVKRRASSCD